MYKAFKWLLQKYFHFWLLFSKYLAWTFSEPPFSPQPQMFQRHLCNVSCYSFIITFLFHASLRYRSSAMTQALLQAQGKRTALHRERRQVWANIKIFRGTHNATHRRCRSIVKLYLKTVVLLTNVPSIKSMKFLCKKAFWGKKLPSRRN